MRPVSGILNFCRMGKFRFHKGETRMASQRVTVMARIKAKKGLEKKVKEGLLSLVGPTRLEKGCINSLLSKLDENIFKVH